MANAMLEVLAHHNRQQSEARDRQEYQRQQDNSESPMADFPSPTPVDRDEPTDLEGLEGTTTAPSPSSSATMVPPPSSSAVPAPVKKKISIQEYNSRKAAEQQRASTYLDRDENGEELDYEDYEPQDDPANIQIGYQTLTPILQIPDLPPLQDASSLASQSAATPAAPNVTIPMPQGNTGPGTVPGTTAHNVATTANQSLGIASGQSFTHAGQDTGSISFTYASWYAGSFATPDTQIQVHRRGNTSTGGNPTMLPPARGSSSEPTGHTDG